MHGTTGIPVSLTTMGGLVTLASPESVPEGASPRNYDMDYLVGSVRTRDGLSNVYSVIDAEEGPNPPTMAASSTWLNPNNILAADGNFTTFNPVSNGNFLDTTIYAFSVPLNDSLTGFEVKVTGYSDVPANLQAQLLINGTPTGETKTLALNQGTPTVLTFGSLSDLWLLFPTPDQVNNTNFGVRFVAAQSGGFTGATVFLDAATMRIGVNTGQSNFNFFTTFTAQDGTVKTILLDADGNLWVENVTTSPGTLSLVRTDITENSYAVGVNGPDVEYLAFNDGFGGSDMPLQYVQQGWIDRITQVGPGAPPVFTPLSSTSTTFGIVNITQPAAKTWTSSYFLQSSGPGSSTPGNVVTFYYSDSTLGGQDNDLVNAFNSGFPTYVYASFTGTTSPFGPQVVRVTAVGLAQPPGQPRAFYYFTFNVNSVAFTYFQGSGHPAFTANYQRTLATLTTTVPVPGLGIGAQITVTGNSVSSWNSVWTITETPNASAMTITGTQVSGGTATYSYSVTAGSNPPVVGQLVTVTGTLNANGELNVVQYPVATVSGTSTGTFTVNGLPATLTAGFEPENGLATTAGTIFDFDPGAALVGTSTNPIFGTGTGGSLVFSASGVFITPGVYQGVQFFITRNGYFTKPSPTVVFTIPNNTTSLQVTNLAIGPPNVVARGIAITEAGQLGVPGANFFTIPDPVDFYVNGTKYTATSFYVRDNTSSSTTLFFNEDVLVNDLSIDSYGYNLFNQIEIGDPGWVTQYAGRLAFGLCKNKVQNFLNLSFDGGVLSGFNAPLGWTTPDNNGRVIASPKFGDAYYISNSTGITIATAGLISQSAYQNYLKKPILNINTKYSVRVTARIPSGNHGGNLVVSLSASGVTFGEFVLPFSSMTTVHEIYTGTILTTAFDTVPASLQLNVSATNLANGADVEIDRIDIFDTSIPILTTTVFLSYAGLPEQIDAITGQVIFASENQQPVNGAMVMYDTMYAIKGRLEGASLYSLQSSPNLEPADWAEPEVAQRSGAIGPMAFDFGEQWLLMASRNGLYLFEGGQPGKIMQEIFQVWDALDWTQGQKFWVRNDVLHRRIFVGVIMPTPNFWLPDAPSNPNPQSPNVILMCNYQGIDTGEGLKSQPQMHTTMFGTLNAIDMRRKWTIWQIPSPYGAIIEGQVDDYVYFGNGKGNSKVYKLDSLASTDDGVTIDSLYTTAGLPELSKRSQMPQLGLSRTRWTYFTSFMESGGNVQVRLLPNVLLGPTDPVTRYNAWPIMGGFNPGNPAMNDCYASLNFVATRTFVEFRQNDGLPGFNLSNLTMTVRKDTWNSIVGSKTL